MKNVLVRILSSAHREGIAQDERFDMMVTGTLQIEKDTVILQYDEVLQENGTPQHVTVTLEDNFITVERTGDLFMQMAFRMGSRTEGVYQTPIGNMELGTFCTRLAYDINEYGGTIQLTYQLDMNGQFAAVHEMELQIVAPQVSNK